jgi:hypothetical protein
VIFWCIIGICFVIGKEGSVSGKTLIVVAAHQFQPLVRIAFPRQNSRWNGRLWLPARSCLVMKSANKAYGGRNRVRRAHTYSSLRTKMALSPEWILHFLAQFLAFHSTLFIQHPYYTRWCNGTSLFAFFLLLSGLNRRREGIYSSVTPNCLPSRTLSENLTLFPLNHFPRRHGIIFINGGCLVAPGNSLGIHKWAACWLNGHLHELCTNLSRYPFIFWVKFKNTFVSTVRFISYRVHGTSVSSPLQSCLPLFPLLRQLT